MTALFEITALCFVADDGDFLGAAGFNDFGGNLRTLYARPAHFGRGAVIDKQDFVKRDLRPLCPIEFFNGNNVPLFHEVLLSAGLYYSHL